MKKLLFFILMVASFLILLFPTNVYAENLILYYDGQEHIYNDIIYDIYIDSEKINFDTPPLVINDRTLIPIRAVTEKLGAEVIWDGAKNKAYIKLKGLNFEFTINDRNVLVNNKTVMIDVPAKLINDRTMVPLRFLCEQLNMGVDWIQNDKKIILRRAELKNITASSENGKLKVQIKTDYQIKNYNVFTLSNPNRIVVDIQNVKAPSELIQIPIKSNFLEMIKYSNFIDNTRNIDAARVTLVIKEEASFDISVVQGAIETVVVPKSGLRVVINDDSSINDRGSDIPTTSPSATATPIPNPTLMPTLTPTPTVSPEYQNITKGIIEVGSRVKAPIKTLKNVIYSNTGDRVCLILQGANLTTGGSNPVNNFSESYDKKNYKYSVSFPKSLAGEIGFGKMNINDGVIKYIEVKDDSANNAVNIDFYAYDNFSYRAVSRFGEGQNDTAITILKPAINGEKLVVIDPGHGGKDPGASYNIEEKKLNLDISIRLNELLKQKGVKTYIIREDDSFVGLYERTLIANDLNAKLFLSIHNNAYYERFRGIETLYFPTSSAPNGLSGERFAQIIQNKLVAALGTYDRGIVPRPNLVVLRDTLMTAALAEVGFITNTEDRTNLLNDVFRQKAAQALCDAVLEALKEVK